MKVMLFTALMFVGAVASAEPVVESVTQSTVLIPACPTCDGGTLVTTTKFKISYVSCMGRAPWGHEIKVDSQPLGIYGAQEKIVSIREIGRLPECLGSSRRRSTEMYTRDLAPNESYILLNPSRLSPQPGVVP